MRQNIRALNNEYEPEEIWRMLIRYLFEYQYLRFSFVPDKREYFLRSTWFAHDYFDCGVLSENRFDALAAALGRVCESFRVDEQWFRPVENDDDPVPAA